MTSFIYSHIHVYRVAMNVLYGGKYDQRFSDVVGLIGDETKTVTELCFGDTVIADWCRVHGIAWTGVDMNPHMCARARQRGHRVIEGDLFSVTLPRAGVCIMAGSLYHFHDRLSELFDMVWHDTTRFILSEPVRNLSSVPGVLGWWAQRSANPGTGHATFRYNERTLLDALREQQARHRFSLQVHTVGRDLLVTLDRATAAGAGAGSDRTAWQ